MPEEDKGFVIKDRRMFSEGEEQKEEKRPDEAKPAEAVREEIDAAPKSETKSNERDEGPGDETLLPEVNFPTFIMSLNASALVHLGIIEDPATGQSTKNLPIAKQTIDIISMLEKKTRGNLSKDEEEIIKNILYDLRLAYVRERE
jgi:hypothetical protein